jgi:hypothetical protein
MFCRQPLTSIKIEVFNRAKVISYRGNYQAVTLEYPKYSINCITNDNEFTFTIPDGAYEVYI